MFGCLTTSIFSKTTGLSSLSESKTVTFAKPDGISEFPLFKYSSVSSSISSPFKILSATIAALWAASVKSTIIVILCNPFAIFSNAFSEPPKPVISGILLASNPASVSASITPEAYESILQYIAV